MPPVLMMGGSALGLTWPAICAEPCSVPGGALWAATLMVTLATERGDHVEAHEPFCRLPSTSGASPLLNEAMTVPLVKALPQSSTTLTSMAAGHPAGTENPDPSAVTAGSSCVGVHVAAAARLSGCATRLAAVDA